MITDGLLLYLIIELHLSSAAAKTFLRGFFFFFFLVLGAATASVFYYFYDLGQIIEKGFLFGIVLKCLLFFISSDCAVSFRAKITTLGHCHLINIWCNTREILQIDMHRYIYIHV